MVINSINTNLLKNKYTTDPSKTSGTSADLQEIRDTGNAMKVSAPTTDTGFASNLIGGVKNVGNTLTQGASNIASNVVNTIGRNKPQTTTNQYPTMDNKPVGTELQSVTPKPTEIKPTTPQAPQDASNMDLNQINNTLNDLLKKQTELRGQVATDQQKAEELRQTENTIKYYQDIQKNKTAIQEQQDYKTAVNEQQKIIKDIQSSQRIRQAEQTVDNIKHNLGYSATMGQPGVSSVKLDAIKSQITEANKSYNELISTENAMKEMDRLGIEYDKSQFLNKMDDLQSELDNNVSKTMQEALNKFNQADLDGLLTDENKMNELRDKLFNEMDTNIANISESNFRKRSILLSQLNETVGLYQNQIKQQQEQQQKKLQFIQDPRGYWIDGTGAPLLDANGNIVKIEKDLPAGIKPIQAGNKMLIPRYDDNGKIVYDETKMMDEPTFSNQLMAGFVNAIQEGRMGPQELESINPMLLQNEKIQQALAENYGVGGPGIQITEDQAISYANQLASGQLSIKDLQSLGIDNQTISDISAYAGQIQPQEQVKYGFSNIGDGTIAVTNPNTGEVEFKTLQKLDGQQLDGGELMKAIASGKIDGSKFFGVYATGDPDGTTRQSIYNKASSMSIQEAINYYGQGKSDITEEMINNTSQKYGIDPYMLVTIMAADSNMGTKGLGATNNNPGNIAQFDSLGTKAVSGYATLQEGVDAVGENLKKRVDALTSSGAVETSGLKESYLERIKNGAVTPSEYSKIQDIAQQEGWLKEYNQALKKGIKSNLTPTQQKSYEALVDDITKGEDYKNMNIFLNGVETVKSGLSQQNGLGDIEAINAFQRMVDPGATVREGDVSLIQSAIPLTGKYSWSYIYGKLKTGDKLPDDIRQQLQKSAVELYNTRLRTYNNGIVTIYKQRADGIGVDQGLVPGLNFKEATMGAEQYLNMNLGQPTQTQQQSQAEWQKYLPAGVTPTQTKPENISGAGTTTQNQNYNNVINEFLNQ